MFPFFFPVRLYCREKNLCIALARRNWLTISNILHHWDLDQCQERMSRPTDQCSNPVVEKSNAVVLCLHCFGDNSERFAFCQHCGVANNGQPKAPTPAQIFGSEGTFQFSPRIWERIEDKFARFTTYKAATHNSRAIVPVMKSFEKFLFSFGHAKIANSNNACRAFNVLESNDTDVVQCPLLGESKFNNKCIALGCERMISVEYLQTGVISKLTEVFCSIGLTAQWDERENCGNPALTCQVTSNFKMVQNQQAKAGVSQRQAAFFLSNQLQDFLRWLAVLLFMPEC